MWILNPFSFRSWLIKLHIVLHKYTIIILLNTNLINSIDTVEYVIVTVVDSSMPIITTSSSFKDGCIQQVKGTFASSDVAQTPFQPFYIL